MASHKGLRPMDVQTMKEQAVKNRLARIAGCAESPLVAEYRLLTCTYLNPRDPATIKRSFGFRLADLPASEREARNYLSRIGATS